jgi:uncharacterized protein
MPAALNDAQVDHLIDVAMAETEPSSIKDMGKLMAHLKPQLQGRADMAKVAARIKARLAGR